MKVAELFAELGFKVQGEDELKAFDTILKSIAQSARNAALALRILSRQQMPAGWRNVVAAAARPAPAAATTAATGSIVPGNPAFIGPLAPGGNTAVNQGLKSLSTFVKQLVGIGSLAYLLKTLIQSIAHMTQRFIEGAFGLDKFTRQTGVSLEQMKRLEQIGAANNISAEEIQDNLASLQQNAVNISAGRGGTSANRWGIDPLSALGNPESILTQFQNVTRGMTQAQAMMVAESAGVSARVAQAWLRERDHPTQITPGLALSKDQLESTRELGAAWNQLMIVMGSLTKQLLGDVAPALTEILHLISALTLFPSQATAPSYFMGGQLPRSAGNTTVNNKVDVRIDGSGQPNETAKATAAAVERVLSDAFYSRPNSFGPLGAGP